MFLEIDIRYPVTYTSGDVISRMEEEARKWDVTVEKVLEIRPVYMDEHGPVITKLMEAYREVTGDETPASVMGGGTYARAMDNAVAFGPVFPGRECTEHQADEWIFIDDLKKAREIYRLAMEKLACD